MPLSGSTKLLAVVPSRTAQSGAPVITASTRALSKLKLLSVRRPGGGVTGRIGLKSQANGAKTTGAGAIIGGGGGGAATGTGGGAGITAGGRAINATGGGTGAGTAAAAGGGAATSAGGGGQAQDAVAISRAETIRMRTRSPFSAFCLRHCRA